MERTFHIAWISALFLLWLVQIPNKLRLRRNVIVENRRDAAEMATLTLVSLGMFVIPIAWLSSDWLDALDYRLPAWCGWAGIAVMAGALVLFWRSHADLGANWSYTLQTREGHTLVTTGVYARVRHPMYLSIFVWVLAQPLMLWNLAAGLGGIASFVPLYLLRRPKEERLMLDRFGKEYRAYMRRTGRLLPRLRGYQAFS